MKYNIKKIFSLLLCLVLVFSLTGCGNKKAEKRYRDYVKSLIAINYLGATDDYIKSTGANQADADALYQANIELLADNILDYYGIQISNASSMRQGYINLAKNIYSKVNYKVSNAYKDGTAYLVDVTIYPIDIFVQTADDVNAYINKFNEGVANGDYNDFTMDQYETEFSTGFLEIMNDACLNMTYGDETVVTVEIIVDDNVYYISDKDFLAIDQAIISSAIPVSE